MEIWKDIKGWEGIYKVSNLGRVKSLKRIGKTKETILKPCKGTKCRYSVNLSLNGFYYLRNIHRLVAEAFLGLDVKSYSVVIHKDGNYENNKASNLKVGTHSEAIQLKKVNSQTIPL